MSEITIIEQRKEALKNAGFEVINKYDLEGALETVDRCESLGCERNLAVSIAIYSQDVASTEFIFQLPPFKGLEIKDGTVRILEDSYDESEVPRQVLEKLKEAEILRLEALQSLSKSLKEIDAVLSSLPTKP